MVRLVAFNLQFDFTVWPSKMGPGFLVETHLASTIRNCRVYVNIYWGNHEAWWFHGDFMDIWWDVGTSYNQKNQRRWRWAQRRWQIIQWGFHQHKNWGFTNRAKHTWSILIDRVLSWDMAVAELIMVYGRYNYVWLMVDVGWCFFWWRFLTYASYIGNYQHPFGSPHEFVKKHRGIFRLAFDAGHLINIGVS